MNISFNYLWKRLGKTVKVNWQYSHI